VREQFLEGIRQAEANSDKADQEDCQPYPLILAYLGHFPGYAALCYQFLFGEPREKLSLCLPIIL
jgi:hypothetical protein